MRNGFVALAMGLAAGLSSLVPHSAAADTALLIVNDRYSNGQNLREAATIERLRGRLTNEGFDVILATDATGAEMRQALGHLLESGEDERILIAAVGHFARSNADNWLLASDADAPTLASISGEGLSLSVLFEVAAAAPGHSIVLLGQERRRMTLGAGLGAGIGQLDLPNGVTAVAGEPEDLAGLVTDVLLVPGADLATALDGARGLRGFGFVSSAVPFLPTADVAPTPVPPVVPTLPRPSAEEIALWNAAQELNTPAAYRAYLTRYPTGAYVIEAQQRIAAIQLDPNTLAQQAEEALQLTRPQRRDVQRHLSILGFYDRGIDGIFGTGTRSALQAWQNSRGIPATGYLDAAQIAALSEQAAIRAAEIEEEERLAREEAERQDRAYWQVTGQGATEEGARNYLDRYPEGLFAEQARARLAEFDNVAWDQARGADTVRAYRDYLAAYPQGDHVEAANARIQALTNPGGGGWQPPLGAPGYTRQELAQFEARETALNLPPVTRSILEQRLASIGLDPGRVDGRFDGNTRNAIYAYQSARGMQATGYFDQITVARLLAEAFGGNGLGNLFR